MPLDGSQILPHGGSQSVPHSGVLGYPSLQWQGGSQERSLSCHQEVVCAQAGSMLGRNASVDRIRSTSPARSAFASGYPDAASGAHRRSRQVLVPREETIAEETKKPGKLRGPERFFYDTSCYTGVARFGGPSVVDKEFKENVGSASQRKGGSMSLPCEGSALTGPIVNAFTEAVAPAPANGPAPSGHRHAPAATHSARRNMVLLR